MQWLTAPISRPVLRGLGSRAYPLYASCYCPVITAARCVRVMKTGGAVTRPLIWFRGDFLSQNSFLVRPVVQGTQAGGGAPPSITTTSPHTALLPAVLTPASHGRHYMAGIISLCLI